MIPLPDLLYPRGRAAIDERLLEELLEMSFLGGTPGADLEETLETVAVPASPWSMDLFSEGLFLDELLGTCFEIALGGKSFPVHRRFLRRVLASPPVDDETIRYRQAILAELAASPALRQRAGRLYEHLFGLLAAFKAPGTGVRLDDSSFRLEILRQIEIVVAEMEGGFGDCVSGLRRLHEVGGEIRASPEMELLAALLDHEDHLADLTLRVRLGADGRVRELAIQDLTENRANRFHHGPLRRWLDRGRLVWRGLDVDPREVANRLIVAVYHQIAPALRTLLQVLGHLEVYLGALGFADTARERGLEVSLAEWAGEGEPLALTRLFNPLLMRQEVRPTPCDVAPRHAAPTVIVTGPNSGGKTRMLQGLGIAQLLGQSGLFVPARRARLPRVEGLFVSLVEHASADQAEGRLGAELVRIRRLFEEIRPGSLVLIDELCSGTNPSEAVEIVRIVLELLRGLRPTAYVTTHFLDYTQELAADPPWPGLEFLHVAPTPGHRPSYQFIPGVATTSLATDTARRLGVTFEALSAVLEERFGVFPARPGPRV